MSAPWRYARGEYKLLPPCIPVRLEDAGATGDDGIVESTVPDPASIDGECLAILLSAHGIAIRQVERLQVHLTSG